MTKNYYRGKPANGSTPWVYGAYYEHEPPLIAFGEQKEKIKPFIVRTKFADWSMPRQAEHVPIKQESEGQFTGKLAGKSYRGAKEEDLMIFEKDILEYMCGDLRWRGIVEWIDQKAVFYIHGYGRLGDYITEEFAIIGNTVENPDMKLITRGPF
jgi:hypothetical protein